MKINSMDTGTALEIVYAAAERLYKRHGEIVSPATCPGDMDTALDTVHDLIVNNFGEDVPDMQMLIAERAAAISLCLA